MHGCLEQVPPSPGCAFRPVRGVPELRSIIAAILDEFEGPIGTIRGAAGALAAAMGPGESAGPHLATALTMCDDVAQLTRRYLEYIEQVEALAPPRLAPERPGELLGEIDRRIAPEAFARGVAWSCGPGGEGRPILTDRALCVEALLEWAALAVESARPGDSVSLATAASDRAEDGGRVVLTLASSAPELIAELASLREDPLFNRLVCVEEVGGDPGSRLALSLERLAMLGADVRLDAAPDGPARAARFRLPAAVAGGDGGDQRRVL